MNRYILSALIYTILVVCPAISAPTEKPLAAAIGAGGPVPTVPPPQPTQKPAGEPGTAAGEPAAAAGEPAAAAGEPAAAAGEPAAAAGGPGSAGGEKPAAAEEKPTTAGEESTSGGDDGPATTLPPLIPGVALEKYMKMPLGSLVGIALGAVAGVAGFGDIIAMVVLKKGAMYRLIQMIKKRKGEYQPLVSKEGEAAAAE